jgi:hypothetical protein
MFKVPYLEQRLGSAAKGTLATAADIGDLSDLKTVDKTSIVGAINEGLSAKGVDLTRAQVFPTVHSSFIAESWFGHLQGRLLNFCVTFSPVSPPYTYTAKSNLDIAYWDEKYFPGSGWSLIVGSINQDSSYPVCLCYTNLNGSQRQLRFKADRDITWTASYRLRVTGIVTIPEQN